MSEDINYNNSNDNILLKRTKSRLYAYAGGKCAPIVIRVPIHVGLINATWWRCRGVFETSAILEQTTKIQQLQKHF